MPLVLEDIAAMSRTAAEERRAGRRIAVVPTMGALHEGHLELIRVARTHGDVVVTTVFVNPSQFGRGEDFDRYPRDLPRDVRLADGAGSDIVFAPRVPEIYPEGYRTWVDVTGLDDLLEGRSRPGHFRGVATVVLKLFQITHAHAAVFGQKDAQQVVVLSRMVRDLNLGVEMVVVPTVRAADGLALSSRNVYLSEEDRRQAPVLYRALQRALEMIRRGETSGQAVVGEVAGMIGRESKGVIDYVSVADAGTLDELETVDGRRDVLISLAVRFGSTRLIDNIRIEAGSRGVPGDVRRSADIDNTV